MKLKREFSIGDKVRIEEDWGWAGSPIGIVSSVPELTATLQGEDYTYWIRFDPAVRDSDGDGPYKSAQVLSRGLVLVDNVRYEVIDPGLEARTVEWVFSQPNPETREL